MPGLPANIRTIIPPEREFDLVEAESRIRRDAEAHGLGLSVRLFGNGAALAEARLFAGDMPLAGGLGKGTPEEARVGALYEAFEHYVTERLHTAANVGLASVEVFNTALLESDQVLAAVATQGGVLAVRRYADCVNSAPCFDYPLFLTAPTYPLAPLPGDHFDYRRLKRYASNNGTAIGASEAEAVLHGLGECIERDALSFFLLRHFYYRSGESLCLVDRGSVPCALATFLSAAEEQLGCAIALLDLGADLGVATYLATPQMPYGPPRVVTGQHPYGVGTSLDPAHAAYRAIAELVQADLARQEIAEARRLQQRALRNVSFYSALQRCIAFDAPGLLITNPVKSVSLRHNEVPRPLESQVARIVDLLTERGFVAGCSLLHRTSQGTVVASVVVPGLERFYLVSGGQVIVPDMRGRSVSPEHRATGNTSP